MSLHHALCTTRSLHSGQWEYKLFPVLCERLELLNLPFSIGQFPSLLVFHLMHVKIRQRFKETLVRSSFSMQQLHLKYYASQILVILTSPNSDYFIFNSEKPLDSIWILLLYDAAWELPLISKLLQLQESFRLFLFPCLFTTGITGLVQCPKTVFRIYVFLLFLYF